VSDATLTSAQCAMLLKELASNDEFRNRYSSKPGAALLELGIPAHTVLNLNPSCLAPRQVADKRVFQDALKGIANDTTGLSLTMQPPAVSFASGGGA
jgi:putative modified peptide